MVLSLLGKAVVAKVEEPDPVDNAENEPPQLRMTRNLCRANNVEPEIPRDSWAYIKMQKELRKGTTFSFHNYSVPEMPILCQNRNIRNEQ